MTQNRKLSHFEEFMLERLPKIMDATWCEDNLLDEFANSMSFLDKIQKNESGGLEVLAVLKEMETDKET